MEITRLVHEPRVFIVLVNWNGKDVTLECLDSLYKVTYRNFRIVVVDNASTDGSVAALKNAFPETLILEMRENLRFAGGNNVGMRHALEEGAEFVLILNNDTTVDREFLSHLVDRMKSDMNIGMVSPKIYYYDDPNRIWFAGGKISLWTGTMSHIGIREIDHGQYDHVREIDYATGCCVLVRRTVAEKVGLFDESFHIYTEDADWSLRVRRAGYAIVYEPGATVWHKLSVSAGGHLSWYKLKNKYFSNLRFFSRYAAWYHWFVFPWASVVVNGVAALRYLATKRND